MEKLLVLDLDGTLLRDDKKVSKENIMKLIEFKEKGNKILFATARPPRDAYKYVPTDLRDNPIICYNGACIIDSKMNILFRQEIERKGVLETIKIAQKNNYDNLCLEINDELFSSFDTTDFFGNVPNNITELEKINFESAYKIIICSKKPIDSEILKQLPHNCKGVLTDDRTLCQIMHINASKWNRIKELSDSLHISAENIIAMGDDNNDIDMIANCGIGVAMGNANEEVKKIAKYVTDTNMNDGVAKFLERVVVEGI